MEIFEPEEGEDIDYTYLISYNESIFNLYVKEKSKQSKSPKKKFETVKLVFDDYKEKFSQYKNFIEIINKVKEEIIKIQFEKKTNNNILKNLVVKIVDLGEKDEKEEIIFEKEIYILNVEYYFTMGLYNKRIYPKPYYSYFKKDKINIFDIQDFIEKNNISNNYEVNNIKYYNKQSNAFQTVDQEYIPVGEKIILEFHVNQIKNLFVNNLLWMQKYFCDEFEHIKYYVNKYSDRKLNYDLIFLYASPIITINNEEEKTPIGYMQEIREIIKIMKKKRKKYNCLFECIGYDSFIDKLINKKTKILHISSHGELDKMGKYCLVLEDLESNGKSNMFQISKIKAIFDLNPDKIKNLDLVILSTCHSEEFGKLFLEKGAKNVIYVDKDVEINDDVCIKFDKYFYQKLLDGNPIDKSFKHAKEDLKNDIELRYIIEGKISELKFDKGMTKEEKEKLKNDYREYSYLKYEYQKDSFYNNICPFKLNGKGNLFINSKIDFDFDAKKSFLQISRRVAMGKIFNQIKETEKNIKHLKYVILYGKKGLSKQDFALLLAVYLYERKIIKAYEVFRINVEDDKIELIQKLKKGNNHIGVRNKKKKVIIVKINFDNKEECFELIKEICDSFCQEYSDKFFIFIIDLEDNELKLNQELIREYCERNNIKIGKGNLISGELNPDLSQKMLLYFYPYLYSNIDLNEKDEEKDKYKEKDEEKEREKEQERKQKKDRIVKELLTKSEYIPDNIKIIAELLMLKFKPEEITKSEFELKIPKINLNQIKDESLYKFYLLLLNMPSGLPDSFLKLIFDKDDLSIIDTKRIIGKYENNWNYIKKDKIIEDDYKIIKETTPIEKTNMDNLYIKTLKLYAQLLNFFIGKKRKDINYARGNIHYIFNSYSNNEIWRSKISNISPELKEEILKNPDFNISKHENNIRNLLSLTIDLLKDKSDMKIENYFSVIEEILLLFPSYYFNKRNCKDILKESIYYCNEIQNIFKKNIAFYQRSQHLKLKLLLFLYSIDGSENLKKEIIAESKKKNENDTLNSYFEIEKNIIFALKDKENKPKNVKNLLENKLITNDIKFKLKYELAIYYFEKENYQQSLKELDFILKNSDEINDIFKCRIMIDRCNVNKRKYLANINKEENEIITNEIEDYKNDDDSKNYKFIKNNFGDLDKILKEPPLRDLYYEAYNLKNEINDDLLEPDIVMLNSNPLINGLNYSYSNCTLNNQYHILNDLCNNIEIFIKLKSNILNRENLISALNRKGEILIIQSDEFTENGDIVLENDKGESEILELNEIFNTLKNKQLNYKVIFLCFPKSSKLIKFFNENIGFQYLITLDFDTSKINSKNLNDYKNLCVESIINFIKYSTEEKNRKNIEDKIFNRIKFDFHSKLNQNEINWSIFLTKNKNINSNIEIEYSNTTENYLNYLFLYNYFPILKPININIKNSSDSEMIHNLIKHINEKNSLILFSNDEFYDKDVAIGFEVIKYYYRHNTYCELCHIDIKNDGKESLKSIVRKLNKIADIEEYEKIDDDIDEISEDKNKQKICFVLIYNCKWIDLIEVNFFSILKSNSSFMIIFKDKFLDKFDVKSDVDNDFKDLIKGNEFLENNKVFLIHNYEDKIFIIDDYNMINSLNRQYEDQNLYFINENLKTDIINYKFGTTINGSLINYELYNKDNNDNDETMKTEKQKEKKEEIIKYMFYKIVKCVKALHVNNFCHLDLKLGNIMLDGKFNPVIINLGTAQKVAGNLTTYGNITEYTPPELLEDNLNYDGYKVDIYNLGVMLFKLVYKKHHFTLPLDECENFKIIKNKNYEEFWKIISNEEKVEMSYNFKDLFNHMVAYPPNERYSLNDIINSNWLKNIDIIFRNKNQEFKDLKQKAENILKNELKKIEKENLLIINTNMNDITLPNAERQIFMNPIIKEIDDDYNKKYNNFIIIENITNPVQLMNKLYIYNNNVYKVKQIQENNQVKFGITITKNNNCEVEIQLYKINNKKNAHKYMIKIDYVRGNLDDYYYSYNTIKHSLLDIIYKKIG